MKKVILYILLTIQTLTLPFGGVVGGLLLTSCGGDDNSNDSGSGSSTDVNNVNANTKEDLPEIYRTRLELPRMKDGNAYKEVVHTTNDYGVNYILEWDVSRRAQRWVCWEWNATNSVTNASRASEPFAPDPSLSASDNPSGLGDYSGSGYTRGHMCASADRLCSTEANVQTFYLSNMHPQIFSFQGYGTGWSGIWLTMENKLRDWRSTYVVSQKGVMYVCKGGTIYGDGSVNINGKTDTGVLANNPENGASNSSMRIPVPKYFFMTTVVKTASGLYKGMAFWAEHKSDHSANWQSYMISIDELEARTGIDFFCNLPDKLENSVESSLVTSDWK